MILFFLLVTLFLSAEEHFEVGEASFDGNRMCFTGNVVWDHPIGNIRAKSAEATFDSNSKTPQEITMQEGVEITLKEGGVLQSPYAWIGCRQCLGIFHGHEGEKIVYENQGEQLALKSLKMELNFIPPKMFPERILAEESVEIEMEPQLHLTGNQATFDQFSTKGVFGRASLLSERGGRCTLKQENNEVNCERVDLDLIKSTVTLFDPEGVLYKNKEPIYFKSGEMFLEKGEEKLKLSPPVRIEWVGVLETDGTAVITQKDKQFNSLFIEGLTKLLWEDHQLIVYDTITVDPVLKTVQMTSSDKNQVYFSDHYGEIFADQMQLSYNEVLKPIKILLEGNVRLENHTMGALQYALADVATFEFEKNTLTLKAITRPRALFYDELNKVQASAPGLIINRDPKNGQNVLRGMGNVRFIFAEEELNELKKRFSFEPK